MQNIKDILLLTIGIILICFACVFVFTRVNILPHFDLSETGQIGDTIGGITSPIIGLFGAVLVYLSFKQQFEANKLQREALTKEIKDQSVNREINQIETLYSQIKEDINNLEFQGMRDDNPSYRRKGFGDMSFEYYTVKGINAIHEFTQNFHSGQVTNEFKIYFFRQINHLLSLIKYLEQKIINIDIPKDDKEHLIMIIQSYYKDIIESKVYELERKTKEVTWIKEEFKFESNRLSELVGYLGKMFQKI